MQANRPDEARFRIHPCRLTRRAFLGSASVGVVAFSGVLGAGVACSRALAAPLPRVHFGRERACIGEQVPLLGWLGKDGPVELRLLGQTGYRATLAAQAVRGRFEVAWPVARQAVPDTPGLHEVRLEARSLPDGRWIAARTPLSVLVHRFAFGL